MATLMQLLLARNMPPNIKCSYTFVHLKKLFNTSGCNIMSFLYSSFELKPKCLQCIAETKPTWTFRYYRMRLYIYQYTAQILTRTGCVNVQYKETRTALIFLTSDPILRVAQNLCVSCSHTLHNVSWISHVHDHLTQKKKLFSFFIAALSTDRVHYKGFD